ncbi:MAG: diaminopimelate dehydrogenase, partial [Oscillospiraceae bacterium]
MIKACIVGYGNIGKSVLEAISASSDVELCGVVRRNVCESLPAELANVRVVDNVNKLAVKPDVAILCTPSRSIPQVAPIYLELGINTVDSYDIHQTIYDVKMELDKVSKASNAVSILAAGWDPGSDSVVRALMESCAPKGITYTNFGPGMSMGHTVAAKSIEGVKAALSM